MSWKLIAYFYCYFFVEKHAIYDAKRNFLWVFFRFVMRIAPFFARTMLQGWQKEYYIKLSNYISWKIYILCVANVFVFASEQNLLWNHLKTNKLTFISCCHKSHFKKWRLFSSLKLFTFLMMHSIVSKSGCGWWWQHVICTWNVRDPLRIIRMNQIYWNKQFKWL